MKNNNALPIKLYVLSEEENLIRLQSQLYIGRDCCDFIFKDNKLYIWGKGEKGIDFYETKNPYVFVRNIDEMRTEKL